MSLRTKPRKMRKRQFGSAKHRKRRNLNAHLSQDLISQYGTRSIQVREGDRVRVVRGDYVGHEEEISDVDVDRGMVYVKELTREKADGTKYFVPIRPSNLEVTNLDLDDERRQKILQRRGMP